ncbi:FAD-dependent monooxygenase [Actinokineospora globicatena]|uniref:FAD-dependent monooxygenase n=1 Tax=Actinokineospora globicatena TaxID=103729 RepID=UPI0020A367F4|nr:FAD-dependent monooxygenase [Actinokineospora globicatena]MCP2301921.1 3-(3-hydroxy-phenyl)propionate hydroxylase [Actinokineospora globicatena]GLW76420.1 oxidoreductase [Actinokineospora globicatena]GLW83255.1 oxidoreductase [Actinokineospora globicatena]
MTEPVLIVGAGPVGMTGALVLARHGVPSVVVDALPGRMLEGSRAICVQRDVLDVLERVGAGHDVVGLGVTWYSGRIFYREHEVFSMKLPEPAPGHFPPFVNTPQNSIEHVLERRVLAEPLIDLRYRTKAVDVSQDDDGVTLTVEGPAGVEEVRGSHCIAADGNRSTLRKLLGIPFEGHSFGDKFLITDIRARFDFPMPERRFYFDPEWNPGRQALLHPQPDSVWRIDWQVPDEYDLAAEQANGDLDKRIRTVIGDIDYELVWASLYRFHQRRVPTMRQGRVLLAGDSAHIMSPFGARGMNSGIADVENAAWKIAAIRRGWGGPGLLDSYDLERGPATDENLRVTSTTMRFLCPADEDEWTRRRDILERSVTDPAARAEIDSGKLSEPYWYLDSPLTTAAPADEIARFPREAGVPRPPLPGVLCPDFAFPDGSRLRDHLGPRFTLLVLDGQAPDETADPADPAHDLRVVVLPADQTALEIPAGGAVLVRPDGFIAAVLPSAESPHDAIRRATGWVVETV